MRISNITAALLLGAALLFHPLTSAAQTEAAAADTLQDQGLTQEDINMVMMVFDGQQPSDIISRADAFIRTGKSPEETARIAYYMYNYYRNSKIMGYDEVAVYIADTYFINGGYTIPDEEKMLEMKLFAESNRRSLIGMQAPELTLQDPSGTMVDIRPGDQDYTVLYFTMTNVPDASVRRLLSCSI